MIQYQERQPLTPLADQLECFWFVSDNEKLSTGPSERILPDGCLEWIFHLGTPYRRWTEAGDWERQPRSFIVGELTKFLLIQPAGQASIMGVRFRPGGAYRFLRISLDTLTDKTIPTGDVWGIEGKRLEEAVLEASDDADRQRLVEEFLLSRLCEHLGTSAIRIGGNGNNTSARTGSCYRSCRRAWMELAPA